MPEWHQHIGRLEATENHQNGPTEPRGLSRRDWRLLTDRKYQMPVEASSTQPIELGDQKYRAHREEWETNRTTLRNVRDAYTNNLPGYEVFARYLHNKEEDTLLHDTQKMPAGSPADRAQIWLVHKELLNHIRDISPTLILEYARNIHDVEVNHILSITQKMPLRQQWTVHDELLNHIRDVSPTLHMDYAEQILSYERDRTIVRTQGKDVGEQRKTHKELLNRVRNIAPHLALEYTRYVLDTERGRMIYDVVNLPTAQRLQRYNNFLTHVKSSYPGFETENMNKMLYIENGRAAKEANLHMKYYYQQQ